MPLAICYRLDFVSLITTLRAWQPRQCPTHPTGHLSGPSLTNLDRRLPEQIMAKALQSYRLLFCRKSSPAWYQIFSSEARKNQQKTRLYWYRKYLFLHQKDFCISPDNKRKKKDKTSKVKIEVATKKKEKAYILWLNHSNNTTSGLSFHQWVKERRGPCGRPCAHLCV